MDYGSRIKYFRKKAGITQKQLEDALHLSDSTISKWERLSYPLLENIEKVCVYFNIPLWRFFAPDDLIIPDMSKEQRQWTEAFDLLPFSLQEMILDITEKLLETYIAAKKGKI